MLKPKPLPCGLTMLDDDNVPVLGTSIDVEEAACEKAGRRRANGKQPPGEKKRKQEKPKKKKGQQMPGDEEGDEEDDDNDGGYDDSEETPKKMDIVVAKETPKKMDIVVATNENLGEDQRHEPEDGPARADQEADQEHEKESPGDAKKDEKKEKDDVRKGKHAKKDKSKGTKRGKAVKDKGDGLRDQSKSKKLSEIWLSLPGEIRDHVSSMGRDEKTAFVNSAFDRSHGRLIPNHTAMYSLIKKREEGQGSKEVMAGYGLEEQTQRVTKQPPPPKQNHTLGMARVNSYHTKGLSPREKHKMLLEN